MKLAITKKLVRLWKFFYTHCVWTFLCLVIIAFAVLTAPGVNAISETARSTESFVDSIGVNTHLYYDNSVYYQKYHEIIKPKLLELGVRHIRDGGIRNLNGYLDRLQELKDLGVGSTLSFDPRGGTPEEGLRLIKDLGLVIEAVEGPNEYDLSGDRHWINTLRDYVQKLYQLVKSDRQTQNLPVLGPSFTSPEAYSAVGNLNNFVDYGVLHNYVSDYHPGNSGWGANGYGSIPYAIDQAHQYAPQKPVITTETGYHNAINDKGEHGFVPETIAQKYIPRLLLEQFNLGIKRTFIYELIDAYDNPQRDIGPLHFGLLRNDGKEKPAFISLKALIQLLKDPDGSNFTPGSLKYTLRGNTKNVHQTLLQKSDGKFYLILWQETAGFDVDTQKPIEVPAQKVQLVLRQTFAKAKLYSLKNYVNPLRQYKNPQKIPLNVRDRPLIIELS